MKISVTVIIRDHLATLYNDSSGKRSYFDIFVFYFFPLLLAIGVYVFDLRLDVNSYSVSITFFGIFLALLLNIQVAIFSIFRHKWKESEDERKAALQDEEMSTRRTLLGELNANISYLTLVSCLALISFFVFYAATCEEGAAPAFGVMLYSHFVLTLLMVIKRAHALFQKEYRDSPR